MQLKLIESAGTQHTIRSFEAGHTGTLQEEGRRFVPHPIARTKEILPGSFDSQMCTSRAQCRQGMCRGIALDMRLDQMPFQFRINPIKICW